MSSSLIAAGERIRKRHNGVNAHLVTQRTSEIGNRLVAVALVAWVRPAARAIRIDPMAALRKE